MLMFRQPVWKQSAFCNSIRCKKYTIQQLQSSYCGLLRKYNITDLRPWVQKKFNQMFYALCHISNYVSRITISMYPNIIRIVSKEICISYRYCMNDPLPFSSNLSFPFIANSVLMPLVLNASVKWNDERTETFVLQHQKLASCLKNKHTGLQP